MHPATPPSGLNPPDADARLLMSPTLPRTFSIVLIAAAALLTGCLAPSSQWQGSWRALDGSAAGSMSMPATASVRQVTPNSWQMQLMLEQAGQPEASWSLLGRRLNGQLLRFEQPRRGGATPSLHPTPRADGAALLKEDRIDGYLIDEEGTTGWFRLWRR